MLQLAWKDEPEIGYYALTLSGHDGKIIDDNLGLWDYQNEVQKQSHSQTPWRYDGIAFFWTWCNGFSHSEEIRIDEGLTLEQAKRRAEVWLLKELIDRYESAVRTAAYLKPIAEWAQKNMEDKKDENSKDYRNL